MSDLGRAFFVCISVRETSGGAKKLSRKFL